MNKKIKVIELLNKIAKGEEVPKKIDYQEEIYKWDEEVLKYADHTGYTLEIYTKKIDLNEEVEILEDNTEEIEELNAYKLMESPYMANLLKEQRYDKFMELLKQSEVEIADKLIKLTWVVKEMRKEKNNV